MAEPAGGGLPTRRRVDQLLVERGLAENRSRAQALVMAGLVWSGDVRLDKSGQSIPADTPIRVKGRDHPWVSRGGVKLAHALDAFNIDPAGQIALDVGASTGGFTDVLLSRGAVRVYAVDVGHGQLDWRVRQDERVIVLERTNVRHLTEALVPQTVGMIVCDVSFIGLETALPAALNLAAGDCTLVALIKPQFEVGRDQVGKKGVVRDPALHEAVTNRIRSWLDAQPGWRVLGVVESPITGPEGNREFLIVARKQGG
jgi:23S rRNA (cytidine1920-2'-O)/16S rRNA (cytidine1409-2'-O)-methyltransferase